jgi:hypothetical protein
MLRASGFDIADHPEEEVFICRRRDEVAGRPDPREMSWLKP